MPLSKVMLSVGCLLPAVVCAYTDVKERLIYNRVTFPMLILGLAYAVYVSRLPDALLGMATGLGIIGVLAAVGGAGGGDVKLAAALGAWFGFWNTLFVLFTSSLIMLVCSSVKLWRSGRLKLWFNDHLLPFAGGLWVTCFYRARGVIPFRKLPESVDSPPPVGEAPYGAYLAAGAWAVCLAKWFISIKI